MKKTILDSHGVTEAIQGLARDILTTDPSADGLALVGVRTGGVFLAGRLGRILEQELGRQVPTGVIDINLYRDDWTRATHKPVVGKTELKFSIDDQRLVLVDDVLFTGRTVRAALDALMDFGRPARIELCVLVDRGHRELPICPNYTGLALTTTLAERVNVYFSEQGDLDEVAVELAG
ncbi:MAG: bifunctional pyr operon transcriptional regulator/uracil phosphoribosyltransferase PyrR [Pseudomonadota bacterium]